MTAGLDSPTLVTTSEVITSEELAPPDQISKPDVATAAGDQNKGNFWLRALVLLTLSGGLGALMAVVGTMVNN